jgi:hypothetical protein
MAVVGPAGFRLAEVDLEDRRETVRALAFALEGGHREAGRKLYALLGDGPRFWDLAIRLPLPVGQAERAVELFLRNPINRSCRWLGIERLVWPHRHHPR